MSPDEKTVSVEMQRLKELQATTNQKIEELAEKRRRAKEVEQRAVALEQKAGELDIREGELNRQRAELKEWEAQLLRQKTETAMARDKAEGLKLEAQQKMEAATTIERAMLKRAAEVAVEKERLKEEKTSHEKLSKEVNAALTRFRGR